MNDFLGWCLEHELAEVLDDGHIVWTEKEEGCCTSHKEKISGAARDARKDLSDDYKNPYHSMGKVWPFKLLAKGKAKAIAPVAK